MSNARPAARRAVQVVAGAGELASTAARLFAQRSEEAIAAHGRFMVALAGGSTPNALYALLATAYRSAITWQAIQFFWGDERHVPPTHPESNFGSAYEALLGRVPVPPEHVHRVHGELPSAASAAADYETTLRREFNLAEGAVPRFDLVLLGMGTDGHTASLFPGSSALHERERIVLSPWVETRHAHRITLSLPVLNQASSVLFLVSGSEKAETLRAVLEGPERPDDLPAQAVVPESGDVRWLVDADAASRLSERQ